MDTVHRFKIGQFVYVQLHDWDPGDNPKFRTWKEVGRIEGLVYSPIGYNVILKRDVVFRGHYPRPVGDSPTGAIFVREGDVFFKQQNLLRDHLRDFVSKLIFREVTAIYTKPPGQIQYINYFSPDGKVSVITDDKKYLKEPNRLAYKVAHFYGFSSPCQGPTYEKGSTSGVDLHYTMNRFGGVNFWEGIKWDPIEKNKAFLLRMGTLICGTATQAKDSNAPSFDQWFVCSRQFKFLCYLLMTDNHEERLRMRRPDILAGLVIPENTDNVYIQHEIPISRFLYAAIYLLAMNEDGSSIQLPIEWRLPERKSPRGSELEPFEVWWPRKLLDG